MPSGDFENPSVVFSSVALATICQGARAYDKTMLAANAAAPEGTMTFAQYPQSPF